MTTSNPMDRWVCCGSPMNGNHALGCIYTRYGTTTSSGGYDEAVAEVERLRAELTRLRGEVQAAERRGARRERERIRGLPLTERLHLRLLWAADPRTVASWSALLAAITEGGTDG